MATTERERCVHFELELRYDAQRRLTRARVAGKNYPSLALEPEVPAGRIEYADGHEAWSDGVATGESVHPFGEQSTSQRSAYDAWVASSLRGLRMLVGNYARPTTRDEYDEVIAYVRRHRLVGFDVPIGNPALDGLLRSYANMLLADELVRFVDVLVELDARVLVAEMVEVANKFSKRVRTEVKARHDAHRKRWAKR